MGMGSRHFFRAQSNGTRDTNIDWNSGSLGRCQVQKGTLDFAHLRAISGAAMGVGVGRRKANDVGAKCCVDEALTIWRHAFSPSSWSGDGMALLSMTRSMGELLTGLTNQHVAGSEK